MQQSPVQNKKGQKIKFSSEDHRLLIKAFIEQFVPHFVPGSIIIYAGDTEAKAGYFDKELLNKLGINVAVHSPMPDVVLYYPNKNWLLLVESFTSHSPIYRKRHEELAKLFANSTAPVVFITAFPSRTIMASYFDIITWETAIWCADAPKHLMHPNSTIFPGPYQLK